MAKKKEVVLDLDTLEWVRAELLGQAASLKKDAKEEAISIKAWIKNGDLESASAQIPVLGALVAQAHILESMPDFLESRTQYRHAINKEVPK
jgi:hypothetical protein